jgi:hypothetical protein
MLDLVDGHHRWPDPSEQAGALLNVEAEPGLVLVPWAGRGNEAHAGVGDRHRTAEDDVDAVVDERRDHDVGEDPT